MGPGQQVHLHLVVGGAHVEIMPVRIGEALLLLPDLVTELTAQALRSRDIFLGITDDEYSEWQSQMKITGLVSLDEFMESGSDVPQGYGGTTAHFDSPEENIEKQELMKMLGEALELLTEKEQKIITLYYYEELTLKEISQVLEVSESRVSQLHTKALQKMREKLGDYLGILTNPR